jgi:flagellar assembly protein FliH
MNSFKRFSDAELARAAPWILPEIQDEHSSLPLPKEYIDFEPEAEAEQKNQAEAADERTPERIALAEQEIEAIRQQAYQEAEARGREEGLRRGREEGLAQGREQGLREGRAQGLRQGREEGLQAGREEGLRIGQEEGQRQAYEEGKAEIDRQVERLSQIMSLLDEPLRCMDEEVENELTALAIALAKQLVRRELRADSGEIVAVAREALSVLPIAARGVCLHLHPDDADLVRASLPVDEREPNWKIAEDPLLTRGGCRVSSQDSFIDATVEKRLASVIALALGDERKGEGEGA